MAPDRDNSPTVFVAILASALAADCPYPLPVSAVDAALAGMEATWGSDMEAFAKGLNDARASLRCVATPLPAATAARFHRMEGLAAYVARDTDRTTKAFAAARALDPDYTFPTDMVPPQNPLRVAYEGSVAGTATVSAPAPKPPYILWVDGAQTRAVPDSRAAVVQVQKGDGAVVDSAWVLPGTPLPAYPKASAGSRVPLLIGAGVLAAGAGTLWALGAQARTATFEEVPLSSDERASRQDLANNLGYATVGVGAAAVLTGAGAFVFGRW